MAGAPFLNLRAQCLASLSEFSNRLPPYRLRSIHQVVEESLLWFGSDESQHTFGYLAAQTRVSRLSLSFKKNS